jgi:hypothetical protein
VLSAEALEKLIIAVGEGISSVFLSELKDGDIIRARTNWYEACILEVASGRVNVYVYDGKKYTLENAFRGQYEIHEAIMLGGSVSFGNYYTGFITKLVKLHLE